MPEPQSAIFMIADVGCAAGVSVFAVINLFLVEEEARVVAVLA